MRSSARRVLGSMAHALVLAGSLGVTLLSATPARADLEGQQACLDRERGSSCTRSSGDIGTCRAEPTLPGVLTCVSDGGSGGASGSHPGGGTGAGAAGYVGTGAQGGSVDGLTCSAAPGANDPSEGIFFSLLCGAAMVLARRAHR